jgi:uncharacterized membrane protein YoaK (UPF0700 family)
MEKGIKTMELIIEIIKLYKSFIYYIFMMFILVLISFFAAKYKLKIPTSLVVTYAVLSLIIIPYIKRFLSEKSGDKFRYITCAFMTCILIIVLIKDYLKNN